MDSHPQLSRITARIVRIEHELAAGYPLDDDPLFEEGRMLLFGPREQI